MGLVDLLLPVPSFDAGAASPPHLVQNSLLAEVSSKKQLAKRKKVQKQEGPGFAKKHRKDEGGDQVVKAPAENEKRSAHVLNGSSWKPDVGARQTELHATKLKKADGLVEGGPEGNSCESAEAGVFLSELERRARKNAKRKQRREKAFAFDGKGQQGDGGENGGEAQKDKVLDAAVASSSKKCARRKPPSLKDADGEESKSRVPVDGEASLDEAAATHSNLMQSSGKRKASSFLDKIQARLWGGQFRMLNETLYTCTGEAAFKLFKKDPSAFEIYHAGYQEQMSKWPKLPVEIIADWLQARSPDLVVADFGCGDARLSKMVKNKVLSLDLVASDSSVIACNMAHTPLDNASADVAVFCLSLMGTDYESYLKEARRVLKPSGWLLIAEVRSRFDASNGGADPKDLAAALKSLGFLPESENFSNKMFIILYFKKEAGKAFHKTRNFKWPELKPCLYKRR